MDLEVSMNEQQLAILCEIAKTKLKIETLETRHSDSLDFHDCAVWNILDALKAAFEAGRNYKG